MINALKIKRIRKALLFTLLMMVVYCIGRSLIVPGITPVKGATTGVFGIFSMLTGGSLETFSLFSLGVGPMITASIVTEMLSMDVIPALKELKEEGQKGRQKINKINQYLGFALALLQAFSMVRLFDKQYGVLVDPSVSNYLFIMLVMASGSMILSWIGSQITAYGVGNGMSVIILFGILVGLPNTIQAAYASIMTLFENPVYNYIAFGVYCLILLLIVYVITLISTGVRKIMISYSGRKLSNGMNMTYLPIKPNTTSVLPLILANSVMTAPLILISYFNYGLYEKLSNTISIGTPWGTVLLAVLIVLLGLFYGMLVLDPEKLASDLAKNNGFIPGIRPGKETRQYLTTTINNTLLVGILGLLLLVIIPYVLVLAFKLPSSISFGGTSLILVVAIVSEIISTIESNVKDGKYKEWF